MDELKHRAGERLEALHEAARTAADSGKSRVQDVINQTAEAIKKIHDEHDTNQLLQMVQETILKVRDAFHELWNNELIVEGRERVVEWSREAVKRIKEGAPPLSPIVLYEELLALFHDRVWRRSMLIFACGLVVGGATGLAVGLRAGARPPTGPHARALHTHSDHTVILVEDAVAPGAAAGEVLVRVQAFSICSLDRSTLRGRGYLLRSLLTRGHVTVGRGFAGVVLDVGHGVQDLEMGDEVWGCVSEWSGGAASELLTIRSTRVSKRPRGVSADRAAALPWGGTAALAALRRLAFHKHNVKGKRVAICGASSGEGCALVQILSGWGAHVTALAPHHTALTLRDLGAQEYVDDQDGSAEHSPSCWLALEQRALRSGPWDAVVACRGARAPNTMPQPTPILKATAPRGAMLDLRPAPLLTDRLPAPLSLVFVASFYTYRVLRWLVGAGSHTDWLEEPLRLRAGLETLTNMVENGELAPILDKVYLPQEFESALAHACSHHALGTTVLRFP
ncbi:reticulon-4-interacting protein 1, mitochondrial isoform X1 [Manduca sexta]|uniref:reticulon-4-interacting protein 1, mitochondrial isoform X1 n=1 Tax=Manduca sexta TaxID=7130 RepID=UPI00189017DD|nr:reticulon-4-interacting protein 1, mitochondrial isoform X1 [Manduca sexta]